MNKENNTQIERLEEGLNKLKNKQFRVYFYVYDTKGKPSGSLAYIYKTALMIKEFGYNVIMLHAESDFVGVKEWLGDKYGDLEHKNVNSGKVNISPSDFLFIPDIYGNIMAQSKDFPCKRVLLMLNSNYFCDTMAVAASLDLMKIYDCITTSEALKGKIKKWFNDLNVQVVRHSVDTELFNEPTQPKQLYVNIIAKTHNDVNRIVKPFYWRYPDYKWITFNDLREVSQENFARELKESPITVWIDDKTDFGISALEAMACKNILIGKVPEDISDWMCDADNVLRDNALWFYRDEVGVDMIANAVETLINDSAPKEIYDEMLKTVSEYTEEKQKEDIVKVYIDGLFKKREEELNIAYKALKNNTKENK